MYRMLQRWETRYGQAKNFFETLEEVNAVLRRREWVEFTPWTPTSGKANEVVLNSDYPDVAPTRNKSKLPTPMPSS